MMTDHEKLLAEQLAVTQAALCEAAGWLRDAASDYGDLGRTRSAQNFHEAADRFTKLGEAK